jgi:SAM-dependent methyltransferase
VNADATSAFEGLWNHNIAYCGDMLEAMPRECGAAFDVGCGDGLLCRAKAPRARQVIGIDPDHASIDAARTRSAGSENVDYVEGDFLGAAFAPASFDFIAAVASLHHMPLDDAFMASSRRCCCRSRTSRCRTCSASSRYAVR